MKANPKIFREYDIRGVADKELTEAVVVPLSRAIGTFLKERGAKTITLGRDCRLSSPRIFEVLLAGLRSTGLNVLDIGLVPTPLLYFSVFELESDGGVMITGSHNPSEHNGFKICSGKTTIHGEDIQVIRELVEKGVFAAGDGWVKQVPIIDRYIAKITSGIKHPLNLRVVIDNGNGMSGLVAAKLFRLLGCKVTDLFAEPDGRFPNHHPDPTVFDNLKDLVTEVRKQDAIVGVAFDGDADRIGIVDQNGTPIFGDELLALFARSILKEHPKAKIISEVKASHRLFKDIALHGGIPILWKTGHSLIKAKMKEEGALLAGEMSGHIFFNDRYYGYDDAIYAAARLFEILAAEKRSPLELLSDLPPSFATPEIRVDCADEIKFDVVSKARAELERRGYNVNAIDGARVEFEDGWGLVRASNTQPVLVYRFEANTEKRRDEIQSLIENIVAPLIG